MKNITYIEHGVIKHGAGHQPTPVTLQSFLVVLVFLKQTFICGNFLV